MDAWGSQLIVGQWVTQSASDKGHLGAGVAVIPEELGQPEAVLADNGYAKRGGSGTGAGGSGGNMISGRGRASRRRSRKRTGCGR